MKGLVRLPNLSSTHSEIVDFVGGLIRVLRHDWPGALELLGNVVKTSEAPNGVKVDAYLYMAVAADGSGSEAYNWVKQAYTINPYSKSVVQMGCDFEFSSADRGGEEDLVRTRGPVAGQGSVVPGLQGAMRCVGFPGALLRATDLF